MTAQTLDSYLDGLDKAAREASAAEDAFRREMVARVRAFEQERAFAFRRLNLMRSIAAAVTGAREADEAAEKAGAAFFHELEWTGATEAQREAAARFRPVALAVWASSRAEAGESDTGAVAEELAAFEQWFAGSRNTAFLSALEREVVELPLVEVC